MVGREVGGIMFNKIGILLFFLYCTHYSALGNSIRNDIKWKAKDGASGKVTCHDSDKICLESGTRIIDGIKVSKACWRYSYKKTCNFPSRNDCSKLKHCYEVGVKECLVHDNFGNCVNQKKEFSCKSRDLHILKRERIKQKLNGNEGKRVVCKGIPCIDGNCVDKSYNMDSNMMESVSQLYAVSRMQGGALGSNLFQGTHDHCSKKPVGYMSCCKVASEGWGKHLSASCSADEISLQKKRVKGLCEYTGKTSTGTAPFHVNKHHFCCFGNLFNKVFQVEARKQLLKGKNRDALFGTGENPDCRGITIEEIMQLDFETMDFSEFAHQIQRNLKMPNIADLEERVKSTFTPIKEQSNSYGKDIQIQENPSLQKAGISEKALKQFEDESDY